MVFGQVVTSLEVLVRHHFSSKLQRMSAILRDNHGRVFVVCKGSPEAIGERIVGKPGNYDEKAQSMAKKGLRVIALSVKLVEGRQLQELSKNRALCETDLT